METSTFIQDLAVVLLAAGFAAVVCHRLRQPKILGYILVGLLLGPHTPPFSMIQDEAEIRTLADLGVIFLMVSLGLEFNFRRFRRVGAQAGFGAVLDVVVMASLGYMAGRQLGWSQVESLFLGGIVCDSSTTVLARSLHEAGYAREKFSSYIIGVTVVEDVLAVGIIAVLTGLAMTGALHAGVVAGSLWVLVLFLIGVVVVGVLTLPKLLNYLGRFESDELLVVPLIGVVFGVALLAARMGLSMAIGAVLVGAIASESRMMHRVGPLIDPLRHIFGAVFFVAIGLMLDPAMLLQHWGPVLLVTALVICGKFSTNVVGAVLTGHDLQTALKAGAGLAQIAEFAFIIAALGISTGAIGQPVYQVAVSAAVLTTLLNPYLMRGGVGLARLVEQSPRLRALSVLVELYGEWAQRIRARQQGGVIRRAIRRSVMTVVIDTVLICAAIACAGYLARKPQVFIPALADYPWLVSSSFWLVAMLACLPLFIAIIRKLEAISMILAEIGLPMTLRSPWARHMRFVVTIMLRLVTSLALLLLIFTLSSAMMPSRSVLFLLMGVTAAIGLWYRPRMVKAYAQAQSAVESIFSAEEQQAPVQPVSGPATTAARVDLGVHIVSLPKDTPVAGLSLQAVDLRARTSAIVVGIQHGRRQVVNPGPDEILKAGDKLFLLGTIIEADAAKRILMGFEKVEQPDGEKKS